MACWRKGRVSDLQSRGPGFDSRSGRHQVVVFEWVTVRLRIGKPSRYIGLTNTKVKSSFLPSGIGKISTDLSAGWG